MKMCSVRRYSTFSKAVTYLKNTGEQLTGHSDVLQAQQQVKTKKEDLRKFRLTLTQAVASYEDVQKKLKGLYARKTQVYQDQKRDIAVLQAINNEEESLLYQEQTLYANVEKCTIKERECFESLSDWIQISHEQERAQSERLKYYSRLGSILGAFFGFLGSNFFLRREIRRNNLTQSKKMESIERLLLNVSAKGEDHTSLVDGEELNRESFTQSIRKELHNTHEMVNGLQQQVSTCSQKLCELVSAQNKLSTIVVGKEARKIVTDAKSLAAHPGLQDRNFLLGVIVYSIGLALCNLL